MKRLCSIGGLQIWSGCAGLISFDYGPVCLHIAVRRGFRSWGREVWRAHDFFQSFGIGPIGLLVVEQFVWPWLDTLWDDVEPS